MSARTADAAQVLAPRRRRGGDPARRALFGAAGVLLVGLVWEGYKAVGPADGVVVGGLRVLPRTDDVAMPHVVDVLTRLAEPTTRAVGADPLWLTVAKAALFSLGVAAVGWVLGVVVGLALALLMQRFRLATSAVLPWVVLSQTVPLIALAPVVRGWGSQIAIAGMAWQPWMSVAVIASYLAFFPVAVGALRGLESPSRAQTDLMRSYAATWWQEIRRLRLPASVPFLLPALRLAAANAIIGTVVAEVSIGLRGGIGRSILEFAQSASGDPAKSWAPILGAMVLGLVAAGSVALLGASLGRFRRGEATA